MRHTQGPELVRQGDEPCRNVNMQNIVLEDTLPKEWHPGMTPRAPIPLYLQARSADPSESLLRGHSTGAEIPRGNQLLTGT